MPSAERRAAAVVNYANSSVGRKGYSQLSHARDQRQQITRSSQIGLDEHGQSVVRMRDSDIRVSDKGFSLFFREPISPRRFFFLVGNGIFGCQLGLLDPAKRPNRSLLAMTC
jgi:hypothetical protein